MLSTATQVRALVNHEMYNPHAFLGIHALDKGRRVIRLWRPGATQVFLEVKGERVEAYRVDEAGLFEYVVPESVTSEEYRVYHQNGMLDHDPYAMVPTYGEVDAHLFALGVHYKLYDVMGGRLCVHQGYTGTKFTLWAPHAKSVALVSDFNYFDGRSNPMRTMGASGVWELFVPGVGQGEKYKFEIRTQEGALRVKADPFAYWSEMRPNTASVVFDVDRFEWNDAEWRERQRTAGKNRPVNIYEVHLGSWKRKEGQFLNYRELAHELASYCNEMHFSHVELLPVNEHPLDESWGYQVTGFYAVTSRFGTPADFQSFVDHLHRHNIGVIVDWVPAHFPTDDFSLARFDGTCLYEHEDPRKGFHPHWNTHIFNYGRREVANFLIGSALFWFDKMHVDGIRVDAVASMLYLDYGRKGGEWIPNKDGGNINYDAIEFMKHLNSVVHHKHPHRWMFAEESTAFEGITRPLDHGGIGFDFKWNMGWMNDTLSYFETKPIFRQHHHHHLTFGLEYAFSEKFALVLSHDEVVHEKRSLYAKMPGDGWQQAANVRLLLSYQMCQPGKQLLFMGGELGQMTEWNCNESLPWHLLDHEWHRKLQRCVKRLNQFYHDCAPLWERDFTSDGFEWIDFSDRKNAVLSYYRIGTHERVVCVHNFTEIYHEDYFVPLRNPTHVGELFNTDSEEFGGSGKLNSIIHIVRDEVGHAVGMSIHLAPLATMIFQVK